MNFTPPVGSNCKGCPCNYEDSKCNLFNKSIRFKPQHQRLAHPTQKCNQCILAIAKTKAPEGQEPTKEEIVELLREIVELVS